MRLKELAVRRGGDTFLFDPEKIVEMEGYNVRNMNSPETLAHIRQMADFIKANGTKGFPPITINQEGDKIYVVAGWCRRRAHILAKNEGAVFDGILAVANTKKKDELILDLLNSNSGLPLTPMEKAQVVKRLLIMNMSPAEIAIKRQCSVSSINDLIVLLNAPPEVEKMVKEGTVSATQAVKTIRRKGSAFAGQELADAVGRAQKQGKMKATAKSINLAPVVKSNGKPIESRFKELLIEICRLSGTEREEAIFHAKICLRDCGVNI